MLSNQFLLCILAVNLAIKDSTEIVYKTYDYPGLEEVSKDYIALMPIPPQKSSYWVQCSAFICDPNKPNEVRELALITVHSHEEPDHVKFREAFLLLATRTGPDLYNSVIHTQWSEKCGVIIPRTISPKFENSTLKKNYVQKIFSFDENITVNDYPKLCCPYPASAGYKRSPPGEGASDLVLLPLTNSHTRDAIIVLGGSYLCAWQIGNNNANELLHFYGLSRMSGFRLHDCFPAYRGPLLYQDSDNDGLYEILILNDRMPLGYAPANRITVTTSHRWNGTQFVEDNVQLYRGQTGADLLDEIHFKNDRLREQITWSASSLIEAKEVMIDQYEYYLGMIYFYREEIWKAKYYLSRVVKKSEDPCLVREAQETLNAIEGN